jgi:hypothetical protein
MFEFERALLEFTASKRTSTEIDRKREYIYWGSYLRTFPRHRRKRFFGPGLNGWANDGWVRLTFLCVSLRHRPIAWASRWWKFKMMAGPAPSFEISSVALFNALYRYLLVRSLSNRDCAVQSSAGMRHLFEIHCLFRACAERLGRVYLALLAQEKSTVFPPWRPRDTRIPSPPHFT